MTLEEELKQLTRTCIVCGTSYLVEGKLSDGSEVIYKDHFNMCPKCSDTLIRIIKQKQDEEYIHYLNATSQWNE